MKTENLIEFSKMTVGQRIKFLRKHFRMTQKEFGESIGLGGSAISMMEQGSPVTRANIQSICKAYGCLNEWLEHGTGDFNAFTKVQPIEILPIQQQSWKDEAYQRLERENALLKTELQHVWAVLKKQMGIIPEELGKVLASNILRASGMFGGLLGVQG